MKSRVLPFVGVVLLVMGLCAQMASAAGTAAGTAISNQASVTYNAGSNQRTATSNTVTLYVAHKVAGAYTPASRTESGVDNRTVYYAVDFVNQGNRRDDLSISFNTNAGYTVSMVNDQDGDGVFDTGEPTITSTGNLNADITIHMLVKVIIASGRTDGEAVTITATLTSTASTAGDTVVANPGATFDFSIGYTVQRPVIVFTATQSDVTSNASRIPGADVTYTMSLDNTSTTSTGVSGSSTVTYVLDPHFKYVSSTSSGALTGADGNGNGGTVTWTFTSGQLAAAQPAISFNVVVEPEQVTSNGTGVASATTVYAMTTGQSTQTKVNYSDGVNSYDQDNANSFSFSVGRAAGCVITQVTANGSGDPTATVEYQYTIKNTGNATDGYDFTQANDATGDLDVAHVFSETSLGTSVTSISSIAQGNTTNFYVRVVIPTSATDGQTIKRDLTATTQVTTPTGPTGGSTYSTDNLITTVTAPNVAVTLAGGESDIISGGVGGKVVPGTVMRWTVVITNNGTGNATSISSSNVNAHLSSNIVDQTSVRIDADGNGTYETTVNSLPYSSGGITASITNGILTVGFPSIPSGSVYRGYQYNVTVQ
jgi:hypothetical protein